MFGPRNGKRSWALRAAVVAGAAGALILGTATTATAKDATPATSGARLSYDSSWEVYLPDTSPGGDKATPVVGFRLAINGTPTIAYCTDLHHEADVGGKYDEGDWKKAYAKDLGKEQWILTNSFPNVSLTGVLSAAQVDTTGIDNTYAETKVVYSATQAAVWHYSDGFKLGDTASTGLHAPSTAEWTAIKKLYNYLVDNAKTVSAPPPTLSFTKPSSTAGPVGSKVGPFTVNTTAKSVRLAADNGGKVVDKDGNAVTSLGDGGQFWVQQAKAGTTNVAAAGIGTVPTGRVFFAEKGPQNRQQIILGGSGKAPVMASVSVTTNVVASASASGTGGGATLPVTGTSLTWIVVAAVVLIGGGGALFVVARRRRTQ